jgi:outer membrane receptor protein involved in Fe transport
VTGKVQLVYELPHGFLLGANYSHQTGRPWARLVDVSSLVGIPKSEQLAEQLDGSRRLKSSDVLDLRMQKQFTLGKEAKLGLFADLLNAFNNDAYDSVQDRLGTSAAFGLPTAFIPPRRLMLGAKFTF